MEDSRKIHANVDKLPCCITTAVLVSCRVRCLGCGRDEARRQSVERRECGDVVGAVRM